MFSLTIGDSLSPCIGVRKTFNASPDILLESIKPMILYS